MAAPARRPIDPNDPSTWEKGYEVQHRITGGYIPKYIQDEKAKMTEEFFRFKDHTRLPKHPAVTGKLHQCWACGNDVDAAKAVFNSRVSPRIGFGQGTEKEPEPIKVCLFCSIDCWMGGWPLVRHHYILAGGGSELAPEYENAPPPETTAEPAAAPATDSVAATAPDAAPPSDSAAAAAPEAAPPQE